MGYEVRYPQNAICSAVAVKEEGESLAPTIAVRWFLLVSHFLVVIFAHRNAVYQDGISFVVTCSINA